MWDASRSLRSPRFNGLTAVWAARSLALPIPRPRRLVMQFNWKRRDRYLRFTLMQKTGLFFVMPTHLQKYTFPREGAANYLYKKETRTSGPPSCITLNSMSIYGLRRMVM